MAEQPTSNPVMAGLGRLDRGSQLIVGAGVVVAIGAVIGTAIDTWAFEYAGLILLLAGAAGAAIAWLVAERRLPNLPVEGRDLLLAASGVAAALGVLALLTILADLDQLDDEYGGTLGVVVSAVVAAAAVVMLLTAWRSGSGQMARPSIASAGRGVMIGLAGAAVALLGWAGNLTVGFWEFSASALVVALIVLAAVALRASGSGAAGRASPIPLSWVAVVLAGLAAVIAFDHFGALSRLGDRVDLEATDWLTFGAYALGVVALLAGSILVAVDERAARPGSEDGTGTT